MFKFTIKSGSVKGKYNIIRVVATVENAGALATNLEKGAELSGNRQDVVWLVGEKDKIEFIEGRAFQQTGSLGGTLKVSGLKPTPGSKKVEWIVAVNDKSSLKIVLSSLKGGTDVREINY